MDAVQLYIIFSDGTLHDSDNNNFASATSAPLKNHISVI